MADLPITTRKPQDTDTERLLLARLLDATATKTTGTALASAARTASTNSSNITTGGASSIVVYLAVTVASGTGGLTMRIRGIDPVSGSAVPLLTATTAITATGSTAYCIGVGVGAVSGATVGVIGGVPLPDTIRIDVVHGDASSYTYSVGYSLIP